MAAPAESSTDFPSIEGCTSWAAGTTLLSVVALYLFGGEVLEGFAFTMLVGIISGTYSTVFIAAAIAIMWQGRKPIKGQVVAASPETRKPGRRGAGCPRTAWG